MSRSGVQFSSRAPLRPAGSPVIARGPPVLAPENETAWARSSATEHDIFAEGTEEEMCFSTFAIVPDT